MKSLLRHKLFKQIDLILFLISIFLIKLPSFYLTPITSKLFTTHTLVKIVIFFITLYLVIKKPRRISLFISQNSYIFSIVLIYFFGISISVFSSKDVFIFWKAYHNNIVGIMLFFLSYILERFNKNNEIFIFKFIVWCGIITILFELICYFFKDFISIFLNMFLQKEYLYFYLVKLSMGRFAVNNNLEIFFPFFFISLFKVKNILHKLLFILFMLFLVFITTIANMRSRMLSLLFSIILCFQFFYMYKNYIYGIKKKLIYFCVFIILIFSIGLGVISSNIENSYSIVDRVLLDDYQQKVKSITFRYGAALASLEYFRYSPIIGVGLGNFVNYNVEDLKYTPSIPQYQKTFNTETRYSPHNIIMQHLSETGLVGTIPLVVLVIVLLINDIKVITKRKGGCMMLGPYIVASWSLFLYMLLNPAQSIFIIGWFWFLRGLIEAMRIKTHNLQFI